MSVKIGMVGLGYWGPNLARNLQATPGAELYALCDADTDRLQRVGRQYPGARLESSYTALLGDAKLDAIVLATPVATHFELAAAAIAAGKHVLVEKPLAVSTSQCRELVTRADAAKLILMTGHVFLFNSAVRVVKKYIDEGSLGRIYYVYSQRLNLGVVRRDVNALWNFAPHDISILNYWLGAAPLGVNARGFSYLQSDVEDVVFMSLDYPGGIGANVHISWLDPRKIRRMTVVGSEKMVVYDDTSAEARIMLYDKGFTKQALGNFENFSEFQLLLRAGDVLIPKLDYSEPLQIECRHFVDCIQTGKRPMTDGEEGLRVVAALEAADRSIRDGGRRVEVDQAP